MPKICSFLIPMGGNEMQPTSTTAGTVNVPDPHGG